MIIKEAKSTKIVLPIPAAHLAPDTKGQIQSIKSKLGKMFNHPEKAVLVGISKIKFVAESIGEWEDIEEAATNPKDKMNNFCGYKVLPVEQLDEISMADFANALKTFNNARLYTKQGFVDPSRILQILNQEKNNCAGNA